MNRPLSWLPQGSVPALRDALAKVAPELAGRPIAVNERVVTSDPRFFQGSAVVDSAFVVKFAWSEPAARRVALEGAVLTALGRAAPDLAIPEVVVASADPALVVTLRILGEPLTSEVAGRLAAGPRHCLVGDLARFLARLHEPGTLTAVQSAGVTLGPPEPQADTASLWHRFPRLIDRAQGELVARWCEWVDAVLAGPAEAVLLHGDLHGHNLVWDSATGAVRAVADFETAGVGDPAYDFRYLPAQAPTVELFRDVARAYTTACGREIVPERVMAWHIRTALGDALWRTEANVALPGGGTPSSWVDELVVRMADVGCGSL